MAKGTLYYSVAMAVFVLSSFSIHIMTARYMGPGLYGIFGVVLSVLSVADLVVRSGVGKAVAKYVAEGKGQFGILKAGLRLQLTIAAVIAIAYFMSGSLIASILGDKTLTLYIRISALCIVPYALDSVYHGYLNGLREFRRDGIASILYSLLKLGTILTILLMGLGVGKILIGYAICARGAVVISRQYGHKFMTNGDDTVLPIKKLGMFAIPLALFSIAENLSMNIDIFLVKRLMHDNSLVGYYISAANLARLPWYILGAFYMTLFPSISGSVSQGDMALTRRYIRQSLRYFLIAVVPVAFIVSVSGRSLIQLFYSDTFLAASSPLSVLIFGMSLMAVFASFSGVISASGKPFISLCLSVIILPIGFGANLILIPKYGLLGAAMASTVMYAVGVVVSGSVVFLKFGKCVSILSISRILIASIAISFLLPRNPVSWVVLLGTYFIALCVYIGILFIVREITTEDIGVFKGMLKSV